MTSARERSLSDGWARAITVMPRGQGERAASGGGPSYDAVQPCDP